MTPAQIIAYTMLVAHSQEKTRKLIAWKGVLALLFIFASAAAFFILLIINRPPAYLAFVATGGFAVVLAVMVQALEPLLTAIAVLLAGQPSAAGQSSGETASAPGQMGEPLSVLEAKQRLDPAQFLEYMRRKSSRFEMAIDELKKGRNDHVDS